MQMKEFFTTVEVNEISGFMHATKYFLPVLKFFSNFSDEAFVRLNYQTMSALVDVLGSKIDGFTFFAHIR
jgi:hypothetical protein